MSAFMETLGITKQGKIVFANFLFVISLVALSYMDNFIIGWSADTRWLPTMGFVLGLALAYLGFWTFQSCSQIGSVKTTTWEKIVFISGFSLFFLGGVFLVANNLIARVFKLTWLYDSRMISVPILLCLGFWILTFFSKIYRNERFWIYIGLVINGLLSICVVAKFFGYGW